MSLASDRPEFMPPASPGRLRAIILALLAHVILIAALTWGVSWKRESSSTPVQAELWSATTQVAAPALVKPAVQPAPQPEPKPVPPPKVPPPPLPVTKAVPPKITAPPPEPVIDPQIAIEQEKKKKADKQKVEKKKALAEAKAKAEAEEARQEALDKKKRLLEAKKTEAKKLEAKKATDEQAKKLASDKKVKADKEAKETAQLEAIRAANMKRIAGLAGASGAESATGSAKQSSGPSPGYGGRVSARIKPNIVFSDDIAGNPTATLEVRTSPDGTIVGRKLIKSSGVKAWDDAVLRAVDKTEVLPRDTDGRVPPSFEINFRPKD